MITTIEYIDIKIKNLRKGIEQDPNNEYYVNLCLKLIDVLQRDKMDLITKGELEKK